jgi:hypothetical protein
MGYTINKRRANNFRKSRQLQINKKATRRQYKGGAKQTKKRGQKGGAIGEFNASDFKAALQRNLDDLFAKYEIIQEWRTKKQNAESGKDPLKPLEAHLINEIKEKKYQTYQEENNKQVEDLFGAKNKRTTARLGRAFQRSLGYSTDRTATNPDYDEQQIEKAKKKLNEEEGDDQTQRGLRVLQSAIATAEAEKKKSKAKKLQEAVAEEAAQRAAEEAERIKTKINDIFVSGGTIVLENVTMIKTKEETQIKIADFAEPIKYDNNIIIKSSNEGDGTKKIVVQYEEPSWRGKTLKEYSIKIPNKQGDFFKYENSSNYIILTVYKNDNEKRYLKIKFDNDSIFKVISNGKTEAIEDKSKVFEYMIADISNQPLAAAP